MAPCAATAATVPSFPVRRMHSAETYPEAG